MVRVRKQQPTLETIFFSSPEQKVIRFLLSEPTTTFTPRVISSRLKGVRGLGGADGIIKILTDLQEIGFVDFVDNHRAVRLQDENPSVQILKTFAAVCDLEGLKVLLAPISGRGILFGPRAEGKAPSDGDYDLFIVSESPEQVVQIARGHPLGKFIKVVTATPEEADGLADRDPALWRQLERGIVLWGSSW